MNLVELPRSDPLNILVLIPIFYAYFFGSVTGLRAWIAVQKVPSSVASAEVDPTSRLKRKRIAICVFLLFLLIGFGINAAVKIYGFEKGLDILNITFITFSFSVLSAAACLTWFGVPMAYHRKPQGGLRVLPKVTELSKHRRISMKIAIAVLSIGLPTGAIWFSNDTCASAMIFIALFAMQGQQGVKTNSLRKLIIQAIVTEVAMIAYIGAIVATILYAVKSEPDVEKPAVNLDDNFKRSQWVYVLFLALPLSRLFATCLRFDFSNHLVEVETAGFTTPLITLQAASAPVAKTPNHQLTDGVVAPTYAAVMSVPFRRPYFCSSLAMWLLATIFVSTLTFCGFIPDLGRVAYAGYVLLVSTPLVVVTIVAMAYSRGELKRMWKYEEVWTAKPAAAAAAVVADAEEVKEKYEVLVDISEESEPLM